MTDSALKKLSRLSKLNLSDQTNVKKCALEATQHILTTKLDLGPLTPNERDIVRDITYKLLMKFFNGRDKKLLSTEYVIAEAVDIVMERGNQVKEPLPLQMALAHLANAFQKFIQKYDTED